MKRRVPILLALVLGLGSWACQPSPAERATRLRALRADVARLADSVASIYGGDASVLAIESDSGDVVVRADRQLLETMIRRGTAAWLDSVDLHLTPNVEVGDGGQVSKSLGLFSVPIGSWDVRVTIQRVDATLRAEPIHLAVADSNRLQLEIPVLVEGATGQARVHFTWDASRVPGLFCSDFELDEVFQGYVDTSRYHLEGYFQFELRDNALVAIPRQTAEVSVSPEPAPEAWARFREVLDDRDGLFSCGMGLDPDDLERQLRGLLGRGFGFKLPESILRPITAPVAIRTTLELNGRQHAVSAVPAGLDLSETALQYSVTIRVLDPGPVEENDPVGG